jgi:WD40 repeat protein
MVNKSRSLFTIGLILVWLLTACAGAAQPPIPQVTTLGRGWISRIAWSSDRQTLAVASSIGVWLYDARALGTKPRLLSGHTDAVSDVAFSPNGRFLASASWDNTVMMWDVAAGKSIKTLKGHQGDVNAVAFAPDGNIIASGGADNQVRLWDARTGKLVATLAGHQNAVESVAFSPDGRLLASGARDNTVRLWDMSDDESLQILRGHEDWIYSVAFAPDGKTLASASRDKTAHLWDVQTGKSIAILTGHDDSLLSIAFAPDGLTLATTSADHTLRLWNAKTGAAESVLQGHDTRVESAVFSMDGKLIISGSADGTLRLWDAKTGEQRMTTTGYNSGFNDTAFVAMPLPDSRSENQRGVLLSADRAFNPAAASPNALPVAKQPEEDALYTASAALASVRMHTSSLFSLAAKVNFTPIINEKDRVNSRNAVAQIATLAMRETPLTAAPLINRISPPSNQTFSDRDLLCPHDRDAIRANANQTASLALNDLTRSAKTSLVNANLNPSGKSVVSRYDGAVQLWEVGR